MKRTWRAAAIWDVVLLGVPVVIAVILVLKGWTAGSARVLLAAVFTAEVFFLLVPPTFYGPGGGVTSRMGNAGAGTPSYEGFEAVVDQKRENSVRRTALDPAAIGPAVCLVLLGLSFLIWS